MNIVITGANGQLGRTLQAALAQQALIPLNRTDLDISSLNLAEQLHTLQPAVVINAAAYTAVDKAESEPGRADQINHQAPKKLAEACKQINSRLIHVSTDFVFDGMQEKAMLRIRVLYGDRPQALRHPRLPR